MFIQLREPSNDDQKTSLVINNRRKTPFAPLDKIAVRASSVIHHIIHIPPKLPFSRPKPHLPTHSFVLLFTAPSSKPFEPQSTQVYPSATGLNPSLDTPAEAVPAFRNLSVKNTGCRTAGSYCPAKQESEIGCADNREGSRRTNGERASIWDFGGWWEGYVWLGRVCC